MTDDSTLDTVNPVNLPTLQSRQWTYHKTTMSTCEHDRREHHGRAWSARCNQWAHRVRALCKHQHQGTCGTDSANHRTVAGVPCQGWSSPPSWAEKKYLEVVTHYRQVEWRVIHGLIQKRRMSWEFKENNQNIARKWQLFSSSSLIKLSDIETGYAACSVALSCCRCNNIGRAWHNPIGPMDIGFPS